ncbi:protein of unknown function [Nitrospira japonica]|uniref:Glycosyltransferase n=1 Tax=Nitrospira japonica TaxID=1325564 RepID=A0A1W1IBB7_9BACT|nr:glycosyltransferase [Nitrospira japonica]SLM50328.1 protein of unknown function [Nitrospira japonica]
MGTYAAWVAAQAGAPPVPLVKRPWLHGFARRWHYDSIEPSVPAGMAAFLRRVRPNHSSPSDPGKLRVLHCIGGLIPGGAERQLCNFVVGAHRRGLELRVLTLRESVDDDAHYADLLQRAGIPPFVAGANFNTDFVRKLRARPGTLELLNRLPVFFLPYTVDILGELLIDPPDLVHAWLDHNNIWAGLAALLAGVPHIVLSTRNVNPNHFPYLAHPLFKPWYQLLASFPHVQFINNSHPGAEDYAAWLDLKPECFRVVHNGVDFDTVVHPKPDAVQAFRDEIRLPSDAPLVAGVFRLSEEKQPMVFFEVVRRAMSRVRNLHAVVAGVGPCEGQLREAIAQYGLADRFRLLGRRKDVEVVMAAATAVLLTSRQEGTPNVLLEAQWLGCPVVSTKAGGAADAVSHGRTGLLFEVGDLDGLTEALLSLVLDRNGRERLSQAAPGFIAERFGLDRMVEETLAVYRQALHPYSTADVKGVR